MTQPGPRGRCLECGEPTQGWHVRCEACHKRLTEQGGPVAHGGDRELGGAARVVGGCGRGIGCIAGCVLGMFIGGVVIGIHDPQASTDDLVRAAPVFLLITIGGGLVGALAGAWGAVELVRRRRRTLPLETDETDD